MPGPGVPCDIGEEAVLAGGAGTGWLGAEGLGCEKGVEALVLAAAAVAPLTVASGAIFAMTPAERPAFDKSLTDEYGRPAMIFFAVAAPTPGKLSKSFSLAVFKSTFWPGAEGLGCEIGAEALGLAAAAVAPLTVASGAIFAMTPAERPAFDKSSTDEYGRPAMIFFAVAAPTPGKLSRSFSLAVFKSTLALVVAGFVEVAVDSFEGLDFLLEVIS